MPGDELRKAMRGEKLGDRLKAGTFNSFIDAAQDFRRRQHDVSSPAPTYSRDADVAVIRNDTGADLEQFDIVGLDVPLILDADNPTSFRGQAMFSGVTPTTAAHSLRFAILQEPLASGSIGRALVSGVSVARVSITSEQVGATILTARITDSDSTHFTAAVDSPGVNILWIDNTASGSRIAIVRLAAVPYVPAGYHQSGYITDFAEQQTQLISGSKVFSTGDDTGFDSRITLRFHYYTGALPPAGVDDPSVSYPYVDGIVKVGRTQTTSSGDPWEDITLMSWDLGDSNGTANTHPKLTLEQQLPAVGASAPTYSELVVRLDEDNFYDTAQHSGGYGIGRGACFSVQGFYGLSDIIITQNGNLTVRGGIVVGWDGAFGSLGGGTPLAVAAGGTGLSSVPIGALLVGAGVGALVTVAPDADTSAMLFSGGSLADPVYRRLAAADLNADVVIHAQVFGG